MVQALLLAPILLTPVKIPRNKGGHCPFRKSQLDSQTFGMAGPTGLWNRYHLGGDLNRLSSTKEKEYELSFLLSSPRKQFKSNLKLTYLAGASLSLTTRIRNSLIS